MAKTKSKANADLLAAVKSGAIADLKEAIQAGADPNVKSSDGQLPIDRAAEYGSAAQAKLLLKAGADISEAGFGARAFAWLLGMSGGHKAAVKAEMREFFLPLLEDPKRKRWVEAIRAGDIKAAAKANKIPKGWKDWKDSVELLPFHLDEAAQSDWMSKEHSRGGISALRYFAVDAVPYFHMSPVESFVADGNHKALDEALSLWSEPARRCRRGFFGIPIDCVGASIRGLHYGSRREKLPLVGLAALRKDEIALRSLIRAGLCPSHPRDWHGAADMVRGIAEARAHESEFMLFKLSPWEKKNKKRSLSSLGVSGDEAEAIENLLLKFARMASELSDAIQRRKAPRTEVQRLLAEGYPPSMDSLAWATEKGDTEMVRMLLEAGLDPNVLDGYGMPTLGGLISSPAEALAIWLEHGASPLTNFDPRSPHFVDGDMPSALYEAVLSGNQDAVRLLLEKSAAPVKLVFIRGGKPVSPMEQLALSNGDECMAIFLRSFYEKQLFGGLPPGSAERPKRIRSGL